MLTHLIGALILLAVWIRFLVFDDLLLLLLLLFIFLLDGHVTRLAITLGVDCLSIWSVDQTSRHVQCDSFALLNSQEHRLSNPQSLQHSRVPRVLLPVLGDGVESI